MMRWYAVEDWCCGLCQSVRGEECRTRSGRVCEPHASRLGKADSLFQSMDVDDLRVVLGRYGQRVAAGETPKRMKLSRPGIGF